MDIAVIDSSINYCFHVKNEVLKGLRQIVISAPTIPWWLWHNQKASDSMKQIDLHMVIKINE